MPVIQKKLGYVLAYLLALTIPSIVLATPLCWQGSYLGGYLGSGYAKNKYSSNAGSVTDTSYFTTTSEINAVNHAASWAKDRSKMIAGIQAGHDWSCNQLLFGVAFDYSTLPSNLSRSKTIDNLPNLNQFTVDVSTRTNWLFTLRSRLGYAIPTCIPSLVYLTGGMAMTKLKVRNAYSDASTFAGIGSSHMSKNQVGWTAGAGIELAVLDHVSVDLEFLHVKVPSVKTHGYITNSEGGFGIPVPAVISPFSTTAKFQTNVYKVGLNYRFNE